MVDARRAAGIGRRVERFAAFSLRIVADDQVAGNEVDLLPMIVHERRGGEGAGLEAEQSGAASHLARFVEVTGENFLLDTCGIAGRRRPAGVHVDAGKFKMRLFLSEVSAPANI